MILFASDNYIEQIKELWKKAFGDTGESTNFYFSNIHKNENMLIDVENGIVRGMLTMHPIELWQNGKCTPARYIYGVATHKDFRLQGISTRLLEYAHGYMREQNVKISLLVPATKELFDFYEKRHYVRAVYLSEKTFLKENINAPEFLYTCDVCDTKEYYEIRKKAFKNCEPFMAWGEDELVKVMAYARFCGGEFYKISTGKAQAAIYASRDAGAVYVRELACDNMSIEDVVSVLHDKFGADKYIVRTLQNDKAGTEYAMICNLKDENIMINGAYFNLAME
ncbi:MAG: GNAT family N-acetyltransferase [Ruminococcaceae bacterium]|nr:GNAT family N-acetyltransferase [Oscillospiraceae bacterium]